MTQLLDYAHGKQVIPLKLPEERDYGEDLASQPTSKLQELLRESRAGLAFIRSGSPVHGLMTKLISALEAEIVRRSTTP